MNVYFYWDDLNNLANFYKNNYKVAQALHQKDNVEIITQLEAKKLTLDLKFKTGVDIVLGEIIIPAAI